MKMYLVCCGTNGGYGGYGDGYGDGGGYGDGDGDGYGYGYGGGDEIIGELRDYEIEIIRTFGVLRIGCQTRTIADWRNNWRAIAEDHDVDITANEVAELIKKLGVSDVE
jgi:hypothetical protein